MALRKGLSIAVLAAVTLLAGVALWHGRQPAGQAPASARTTPSSSTAVSPTPGRPSWSAEQIGRLQSIALTALPAQPQDPSNAYVGDPAAVALGQALFFDARLGRDGRACASCHQPRLAFGDGQRLAPGSTRHTPTLYGVAWGHWFNWDGSADSLWSQALGPMESAAEMGRTRGEVVQSVAADAGLRGQFERVFGRVPAMPAATGGTAAACGPRGDPRAQACWEALSSEQRRAVTQDFVHVGKALAAYMATLRPPQTRVDRFADALRTGANDEAQRLLTAPEQRGLQLFLDTNRTRCLQCHNGPLLSNGGFHDIGTRRSPAEVGRLLGLQRVATSEFRCDGPHSDALPEQCLHLRFQRSSGLGTGSGALKVPTLRELAHSGPYLHDGRLPDLRSVLAHYQSPGAGGHELQPLLLNEGELQDLAAFLGALSSDAR